MRVILEPAVRTLPYPRTHATGSLHRRYPKRRLNSRGARGARLVGPLLRCGVPGAIAFSRVYRGQHHISDTVAGALLGIWGSAHSGWGEALGRGVTG
ncbi:phosphatase PAP2 family protein [Microbacterium aurum]